MFIVAILKITERGTTIYTIAPFSPLWIIRAWTSLPASGVFPRPQFIYFRCLLVSPERNKTGRLHTYLYLIAFDPIE